MPDVNRPETYNDARIDAVARPLYYATLLKLRTLVAIAEPTDRDLARITAYSAAAEAASCGMMDDNEDDLGE